jgi:serine/threonine-protein kinase
VEGESLRDRLKRSKPLPLDDALRIGADILRGLAYAHAKGVIHRDIKPANILLTSEGQAKIADFGIARPVDSDLTAVGSMLGTPNYMSPEQVKCDTVTTRSDLFSVGVVMYEMLAGVKPFTASDVSGILRNVVEKNPPLASEVNPDVPEPIARFVAGLFAKKPDHRVASAAEALAELQDLRSMTPATSAEGTPGEAAANPAPRVAGTADQPSDDDTAAVSRSGLTTQREVPPPIFWGVVAALILPIAAAAAFIHASTDPRPTAVIEPAKVVEFAAKKRALIAAKSLTAAGRYDEAIAAYDGYLKRYPKSITAQQGRADTVKALDRAKSKSTVTSDSKSPPDKQKNLWQRIFRRRK